MPKPVVGSIVRYAACFMIVTDWNYADLPAAFGGGDHAVGFKVTTEGELERALVAAFAEDDKFFLIEICLPDRDCSAGLKQLGDTFRQMVSVKQP